MLVITLIALLLLAALVMYVFNTGRQVTRRVESQDAADVAAMDSAAHIARSLNTVAMNNVAMARYIALVDCLVAMPVPVRAALHEQSFFHDRLAEGISQVGSGQSGVAGAWLGELTLLLEELSAEVDQFQQMDGMFQTNPVGRWTHYGPDSNDLDAQAADRGLLWQAMEALDKHNQVLVEQMPRTTILSGVRDSKAVMRPGSAAVVVGGGPATERRVFDDFENPVIHGHVWTGGVAQQYVRGPFDTLFGWRVSQYETIPGTGTPGLPGQPGGVVDTGGVSSPFGGSPTNGARPGGGGTPGIQVSRAYRTYGTYPWARQEVIDHALHRHPRNLDRSRFPHWFGLIADRKMEYLWPGDSRQSVFSVPDWESGVPPEALETPDPPVLQPLPLSETGFIRLDIKSRYPRGSSQFLSAGSWAFNNERARHRGHESVAEIGRVPGWWLPQRTRPDGTPYYMTNPVELTTDVLHVTQIGATTWMIEFTYRVSFDYDIGIEPETDPDTDQPIMHDAYFIQLIIYAGVNRNIRRPGLHGEASYPTDTLIDSPWENLNVDSALPPAPMCLDYEANPDPRRGGYGGAVLGVVKQPDTASLWPSRFAGNKPLPGVVAVSRAVVFNNHSYDLWTQMWHAQLAPVGDLEPWLDRLDAARDVDLLDLGVARHDVEELHHYLRSLQSLAQAGFLTH